MCGLAFFLVGVRAESLAASPAPVEKARPNPAAAEAAGGHGVAMGDAKPAAQPPLAPLTKGKRLRITRLYEIKPLEIVVPDGVKLKMENMDGGELLPRAELRGGAVDIEVMRPEDGFRGLQQDLKMQATGVTIVRADELADGYLWIQKYRDAFTVFVSRPGLKVTCAQSQLKSLADAEVAASVCLSLRAAKAP